MYTCCVYKLIIQCITYSLNGLTMYELVVISLTRHLYFCLAHVGVGFSQGLREPSHDVLMQFCRRLSIT